MAVAVVRLARHWRKRITAGHRRATEPWVMLTPWLLAIVSSIKAIAWYALLLKFHQRLDLVLGFGI